MAKLTFMNSSPLKHPQMRGIHFFSSDFIFFQAKYPIIHNTKIELTIIPEYAMMNRALVCMIKMSFLKIIWKYTYHPHKA